MENREGYYLVFFFVERGLFNPIYLGMKFNNVKVLLMTWSLCQNEICFFTIAVRGSIKEVAPLPLISIFVSSEGALYVILPYDYPATF